MAQDAECRHEQDGTITDMRPIDAVAAMGRRLFVVLSCVTLVAWTLAPSSSHAPKVIETLQAHAEMVADHGHSHGLEEDLAWALHGHSHDVADHDHTQAVLSQVRVVGVPVAWRTASARFSATHWSPPRYRLERPPRA